MLNNTINHSEHTWQYTGTENFSCFIYKGMRREIMLIQEVNLQSSALKPIHIKNNFIDIDKPAFNDADYCKLTDIICAKSYLQPSYHKKLISIHLNHANEKAYACRSKIALIIIYCLLTVMEGIVTKVSSHKIHYALFPVTAILAHALKH